jgi:hypothetical protein
MPIVSRVDHAHRVIAEWGGVLQDTEVFRYEETVWTRPDVAGYDELVDLSGIEEIVTLTTDQVQRLAALSAAMDKPASHDPGQPTRLAIVAPDERTQQLSRLYQSFREMHPSTTREVAVFHTRADALAYLGVEATDH